MPEVRPIGDYRGSRYEDQFQWQESSFHGCRYWVRNFLDKGQGRVTPFGDAYKYEVFDYRFKPVESFSGTAPSLSEAQRIVDEAFSSMDEEVTLLGTR